MDIEGGIPWCEGQFKTWLQLYHHGSLMPMRPTVDQVKELSIQLPKLPKGDLDEVLARVRRVLDTAS